MNVDALSSQFSFSILIFYFLFRNFELSTFKSSFIFKFEMFSYFKIWLFEILILTPRPLPLLYIWGISRQIDQAENPEKNLFSENKFKAVKEFIWIKKK